MTFARRLSGVEEIRQQDSAERAFNKLMRTFAAQVDTLKRYRTGGQQKVIVEHHHKHLWVGEGGQPITKDVTPASRGTALDERTASGPTLLHSQSPPMT